VQDNHRLLVTIHVVDHDNVVHAVRDVRQDGGLDVAKQRQRALLVDLVEEVTEQTPLTHFVEEIDQRRPLDLRQRRKEHDDEL